MMFRWKVFRLAPGWYVARPAPSTRVGVFEIDSQKWEVVNKNAPYPTWRSAYAFAYVNAHPLEDLDEINA